ncbi:MAG: rhodanese-like domain-containing protein [Gammaproteobacteria bacterium]
MESGTQPLKRCGCGAPTEKCPDLPRTIAPAEVNPDAALVFDVRREADYAASNETLPGAMWKNPDKIDAWIGALPLTLDVVVYCVRGGSVSNAVVDRLQAAGVKARYIEGGIEAYKAAGGTLARK